MSEPQLRDILCEGPAGPHRMAWWQWGPSDAADLVVCVHGLGRQGQWFLPPAPGHGRTEACTQ